MPLSNINNLQTSQINDLDNYLMAKSIQSTIEKHIYISDDKKRVLTASQTSDMASFGTPVLNLLVEFQAMQGEQ